MSEMDLHGDVEAPGSTDPLPQSLDELADDDVPVADAVEQAITVTEPEPDHEVVSLDDDDYR